MMTRKWPWVIPGGRGSVRAGMRPGSPGGSPSQDRAKAFTTWRSMPVKPITPQPGGRAVKRLDRPMPWVLLWSVLLALLLPANRAASPAAGAGLDEPARVTADVILRGGTVIDGTGAPGRRADVALRGDRIVAVGSFEADPGAKVIDAAGLIVAPGFIDLHTHSDQGITQPRTRSNANYVTQGVTTIVTGNCGGGVLDVARYFAAIDAHGAGTNVIHLVPHGDVRSAILGNAERAPSPAELDRMKQLVERGMQAGAWGLSTGLIYVPGRYARTDELIELARVVRRHGGFTPRISATKAPGCSRPIDEAIAVGKGAEVPVHISHLKASGKANWGTVRGALERIAAARAGGLEGLGRPVSVYRLEHQAGGDGGPALGRPRGRRGVRPAGRRPGARRRAAPRDRSRAGRAGRRGIDPDRAATSRDPSGPASTWSTIAGQAGTTAARGRPGYPAARRGAGDQLRHVRGGRPRGDATRVRRHGVRRLDPPARPRRSAPPARLRHVPAQDPLRARRQGALARAGDPVVLGLPAEILGLADRGVIRVGAFADLVAFDPATFRDAATFDQPTRYAPGVRHLFVNGVAMIADGRLRTAVGQGGKLPGRALRLQQEGPADLIVKVGRIWTGDPAHPWAEALAIRGGAIAAVG